MSLNLTEYKLLSFDIYATLIDWESGIYKALQPLVERLPVDSPYHPSTFSSLTGHRNAVLRVFASNEHALQTEQPTLLYSAVLAATYGRLAAQFSVPSSTAEASAFADSIGVWQAFPDTVGAMQALGKHYKIAALSNVDRASFSRTLTGPLTGVRFDAIYTAEDIGSYKPSLDNFRYLISHAHDEFGFRKDEILLVAHSLVHDHVPGKEIGLRPGVWIAREGERSAMGGSLEELQAAGKVVIGAIYGSLGDLADAVEKAFEGKE